MTKISESETLALLIRNAKSRARKIDLLTLAEASEYLEKRYGSKKEVARRTGVAPETLRVYGLVRRLPVEIKRLVRSRLLDNPEVVEAILRVPSREKQIELAYAVVSYGLNTKDTRDIEKFARYNPNASIQQSVSRVLHSKPTIERRYVVVTTLSESTLRHLSELQCQGRGHLESIVKALGIPSIMSCDLHDGTLIIVVGESGFAALKTRAKEMGVSLEHVINRVVGRELA